MKQCMISDSINGCFWWMFEFDGEDDPKWIEFDKELVKLNLNWATMCNVLGVKGTRTSDGYDLQWGEPSAVEGFEQRPIRLIREFEEGGYTNDKLQIKEIIRLLDDMQIFE